MGETMTEQAEQSVAVRVLTEELKRLEMDEEVYLDRKVRAADTLEALDDKLAEIVAARAEVEQAICDLVGEVPA